MKKTTARKIKQRTQSTDSKRKELIFRYGYKCCKCGTTIQNDNPKDIKTYMTVGRIIPKEYGGTLEIKNLQALCYKCNERSSKK